MPSGWTRYRILYITDALHPENAQIFPLPNPRSREGLAFSRTSTPDIGSIFRSNREADRSGALSCIIGKESA